MLCPAFAGVVCVASLTLSASLSLRLMQVVVLAAAHGANMVSPEREEEAELDFSSGLSTSLDSSTAPCSTLSSNWWLLIRLCCLSKQNRHRSHLELQGRLLWLTVLPVFKGPGFVGKGVQFVGVAIRVVGVGHLAIG